jgi:PAN domain
MDRLTVGSSSTLKATEGSEYLENNCADEPTKLCEFKKISGRILKTVDSVFQDVANIDDCRELCLNAPFRCHSYDFGDTGDMVCRLSHNSRATLSDIQDPYLDVPEASTYELSSCYNVSIECRADEMVAKIKTSKMFDGKVYAKGSPNSCAVNVKNALEFDLTMKYNDLECNVRQNGLGRYLTDVVIQHHKMIVTSSDLGLALTCQYDLTNKTVSNDADLDVIGDIETALNEEVVVDSPNVIMKITTRDGSAMKESAEVGDPLALKFEIMDEQSPYEIFVRELVAMNGADSGEITLIDSRGCPTDHFIMGPIYKSSNTGKILLSHFDAFKFPSSSTVQFRALVTPCHPTCEPVQCDDSNFGGELRSIISFGRKKRSANESSIIERKRRDALTNPHEDLLLVQSITISDKFGFAQKQQDLAVKPTYGDSETVFYATPDSTTGGYCVNGIGKQNFQPDFNRILTKISSLQVSSLQRPASSWPSLW